MQISKVLNIMIINDMFYVIMWEMIICDRPVTYVCNFYWNTFERTNKACLKFVYFMEYNMNYEKRKKSSDLDPAHLSNNLMGMLGSKIRNSGWNDRGIFFSLNVNKLYLLYIYIYIYNLNSITSFFDKCRKIVPQYAIINFLDNICETLSFLT